MEKIHFKGYVRSKLSNFLLFFEGLSLTRKFFVVYLIIFAIPMVLLGWVFSNELRKNAETEAWNRSRQDIGQIRSDILKNIEICKNSGEVASRTKNFLEGISVNQNYSLEEMLIFRDDVLTNIENVLNINTLINKLRFFIKNQNLNEVYPSLRYESDIINQAWYNEVLKQKGKVYWWLNHFEDDYDTTGIKNYEVVSLMQEIKFNGEHVGVKEVNMLTDVFYGNIYSNTDNADSFIYIVKDENEHYYNHESKFFKENELSPENIKSQLIKNTLGYDGSFKLNTDKLSLGVTYTYIDFMDIFVYQIVSFSKINSEFVKLQVAAMFVVVLIIAMFLLVTNLISSVLLRKIRIIVTYMRRIQAGEMFVDIPSQGNDEIGELSRHFNVMLNKINELIFTVVKKQASTKDAEIKALHSQINAHFIYNVLESVKMMAIVDYKYDIADTLTTLGRLMRYSMNWKRKYVFLEDEIKHIRGYIQLMNLRFDNSIILEVSVPQHLLRHEVLKMILQPIVENAVNHGLEPKGNGGKISIKAYTTQQLLNIDITDNGVGMGEESLNSLRDGISSETSYEPHNVSGNGIALSNVHQRLKLFYGESFGLSVESKLQQFTMVKIKIPYVLTNSEEMEHGQESIVGRR